MQSPEGKGIGLLEKWERAQYGWSPARKRGNGEGEEGEGGRGDGNHAWRRGGVWI